MASEKGGEETLKKPKKPKTKKTKANVEKRG